jgi:hypothetical protein
MVVAALLLAAGQLSAAEWSIRLRGATELQLDAARFAAAKEQTSHYTEITVEEKGRSVRYLGMPLWYLVAMVDEGSEEPPYRFDKEAWKAGYEITITAADGYSATFVTSDYPKDALYLADRREGEAISPRIVGNVSRRLQVKQVREIELFSPAASGGAEEASSGGGSTEARQAQAPDFSLTLTAGGESRSFSIETLEGMDIYTEGRGAYTTSVGRSYTHRYGGVKLAELLRRHGELEPDTVVTFVAADGYRMQYTGREIMQRGNGEWILAFKRDGEYLPEDPGYIRTVKVGPGTPNIPGSKSVRMVAEIEVDAEE